MEDYQDDAYSEMPTNSPALSLKPQSGGNFSTFALIAGLVFTTLAFGIRGCATETSANADNTAPAVSQDFNNAQTDEAEPKVTQPSILIPSTNNQILCVLSNGGESCFSETYLPCVAKVDGQCTQRLTINPLPKNESENQEPQLNDNHSITRCSRWFNGRCWKQDRF